MSDTIETRWEQQNEAGRLSFTDGDYARAEQSFLAAIREATQLGADNVRLASSLSNLGQLKYKQKDLAQAEALFHRALAIRERVLGPEHFGLVQNINNLAALHYARGELDQAEPLFQRALAISEQHLGESHPDVAVTLNNLARLYFRRADYADAAPLLARLLAIKEQSLGPSHPEIAAILTSLAKVRLAAADYDGGEQFARRALEIRERLQLPNDLAVATALETLAEIFGKRGRVDEELHTRERVLEIRTSAMGVDHPTVVAARAALQARRAAVAPIAEPPAPLAAPLAAPPVAPPVAASPPAAAPPPLVLTPPPSAPPLTTRTSSLPWIDAPQPPSFDRSAPPVAPIRNASNGEVTGPVRNGNGNGNGNGHGIGITAPRVVESPLAFHPSSDESIVHPPAPPTVQRAPAPPIVHEVEQRSSSDDAFTHSFQRLVAETPSARRAIEEDAPPPTNLIADPRREISLDWPIEPRRPWMRIAVGVAALALIAGGGWFFLSRNASASGNKTSATEQTAVAPPKAPAPARDSVAARRDSIVATPSTSIAAHGAKATPQAELVSNLKSVPPAAHAGKAAPAPAPAQPPAADADVDVIVTPKLPSIKVDAITRMIADSARARADSVGRAIPEKPPTFNPKAYTPPGS